jgi:hypothetical protein
MLKECDIPLQRIQFLLGLADQQFVSHSGQLLPVKSFLSRPMLARYLNSTLSEHG